MSKQDRTKGDVVWSWIMWGCAAAGALLSVYPAFVFVNWISTTADPAKIDTWSNILLAFLFICTVTLGGCFGGLLGNHIGFNVSFKVDFNESYKDLRQKYMNRK